MNRATLGKLVRYGFIVVAIGFLVWAVASRWTDFAAAIGRLSWPVIVAAAASILASLVANMFSWRSAIASVALPLPSGAAANVFFISQLGKYVPGSVWPVLAQMEMGSKHGISRVRSAVGSIIAMIVGLTVAIFVTCVCLLSSGSGALATYWWLIPVAIGCVVVLLPPVLERCLVVAMKVLRRGRLEEPVKVRWQQLAMSVAWSLVGWLLLGLQAWVLLRDLSGTTPVQFTTALGAFALAWAAGFVVVFAPGGVGVREAALAIGLGGLIGAADATAFALVSRIMMTLADVLAAGVAVVIARRMGLMRRPVAPPGAVDADSD